MSNPNQVVVSQVSDVTTVEVTTRGPQGPTVPDGNKGDVTVSSNGTAFTINNNAVTSAKILDGTIVDADINASAAISLSKLATGALPTAITVTSANISDLSIVDADISSSAAISLSKLATGALPTAITVTSANISDLSIVNADVNGSAAIAGTKISPDFGSQNIVTTGTGSTGALGVTGDITVSGTVDGRDLAADGTKLDGIETGATADQTKSDIDALGIAASTATTLQTSRTIAGTSFDGSANIDISYTNLTNKLSVGDGGLTQNNFTDALKTKLDGVETGATADQTASEILSLLSDQNISTTGNIVVGGTVDGVDIAARNTLFGGLTSSSGVLTNGVTATTQSASDNSTKVATTAYTDTAISNLINSAPSTLDTLKELSDALGSDPNFATTVTNSIATKLPLAGGQMTGNITFSGTQTVDGRDLSVDGAKLDGGIMLADGDKGDITVSNSGATFTIDNGVVTGAKLANSIDLSDNQKIRFGDNNDMNIKHDGSNSIIQDNGTGNLILKTNGVGVAITTGGGGQIAEFNNAGSCTLRHQTTERIATSSTGVSVTGNIAVTGTVDGRDVATDGTKLDGIESNATADQTASEIKTLFNSSGLVNAQIDASAAIAGTKISPDFGSQNVSMGEQLVLSATTPNILFTDTNHNPDYRLKIDNGAFTIEDAGDNSDKFVINSDGHVDITGNLDVGAGIDVTGDIIIDDSIVHAGDTDTKITFPAHNKVSIETGGSERFRITPTGRIEQSNNNEDIDMDGSANGQLRLDGNGYNAALALNTDGLNIYCNSANRGIIFGTNETERVRITNIGRVGIGTTNPSSLLHVAGAGIPTIKLEDTDTAGGFAHFEVNGAALFIESYDEDSTEGQILFKNATNEAMRINTAGNVGIGTTNPLKKLHIADAGDVALMLQTTNAVDDKEIWEIGCAGNASNHADLIFRTRVNAGTGGDEAFRITNSGNVGIGTASPDTLLDVSSSNDAVVRIQSEGSDATDDARLEIKTTNGTFTIQNDRSLGTSGALTFAGNISNNLVIDHDTGNVGIGTTSPSALLHVDSDSTTAGIRISGDGNAFLELDADSSVAGTQIGFIDFKLAGTVEANIAINESVSGNPLELNSATNHNIAMVTGGGNVGIGTASPTGQLHISSGTSGDCRVYIEADTDNNNEGDNPFIIFKQDGGVENASVWCGNAGGTNDNSLNLSAGASVNGGIRFLTSSTDGGWETADERMRIDSSGRVGINQTSFATSDTMLSISELTGHLEVGLLSKNDSACVINFGDPEDYNIGRIKYANDDNSMRFDVNDAERMRIDSSGRLLIGGSSNQSTRTGTSTFSPSLQVISDNEAAASITRYSDSSDCGRLSIQKGRGTKASKVVVQNNDNIGEILFSGWDGDTFTNGAKIECEVDGTPGDDDMPGRLIFSTTANGSDSATERMRITSDNAPTLLIGQTSAHADANGWTLRGAINSSSCKFTSTDIRSFIDFSSYHSTGSEQSKIFFQTDGKIFARTTSIQAYSSERRTKKNIVALNLEKAWNTLRNTPFYTFNFKDEIEGTAFHHGPIVDECPEDLIVPTQKEDEVGIINTVNSEKLQYRAYSALQQALKRIEELETKVAALEAA